MTLPIRIIVDINTRLRAAHICGPRYSILRKFPFDRKNTSMEEFSLCPVNANKNIETQAIVGFMPKLLVVQIAVQN